jgi:F-type H+-transporting ATPase subunit delta
VSTLLANFLGVVNRKGRLRLLRQIASAYQELLEEQLGKIEVDVIVAEKLSADQIEQVRGRVSAALKRDAVVHQYVDPAIIGGLVIRVEDRLLDASVRAQLRAIRRQLLAARPR